MNFKKLAILLALCVSCGDNQPATTKEPCYNDPGKPLRFADQISVTQKDALECYAVYTVFTDHVEFFCPCSEQSDCSVALEYLSSEASECGTLK